MRRILSRGKISDVLLLYLNIFLTFVVRFHSIALVLGSMKYQPDGFQLAIAYAALVSKVRSLYYLFNVPVYLGAIQTVELNCISGGISSIHLSVHLFVHKPFLLSQMSQNFPSRSLCRLCQNLSKMFFMGLDVLV